MLECRKGVTRMFRKKKSQIILNNKQNCIVKSFRINKKPLRRYLLHMLKHKKIHTYKKTNIHPNRALCNDSEKQNKLSGYMGVICPNVNVK